MAITRCRICGEIIMSTPVKVLKGFIHERCWEKRNTPEEVLSFREILAMEEEKVLVRNLLATHVPAKVKTAIVAAFNTMRCKRRK